MSDGDNATPGRHGRGASSSPDDQSETYQWHTRRSHPSPGAAPWERAHVSDNDDAPTEEPSASSVGNHTDGVTVADLIAKLNGDEAVPAELKRDRPDLSTPPPAEPPPSPLTEVIDAVPAYGRHERPFGPDIEPHEAAADVPEAEDYYDTEIIPAVAMDLPDLTSTHRHGRVPPSHVGAGRRRTDEHQPSRGRHRSMIVGRVVTALIAVLALALTGGAWQWQSAKNNMLNRISALDPDSRDILDPNAQFGDENFLIVGVDSRMGENVDMGAGTTDEAAGARSDTVMLVNIPANRERVVAVSFPRDLAIEPMQCEPWDPKTGEYGPITDPESPMYGADRVYTEYKLNSAYAVGGPKCLVKVIQKLSGLYVNRFMAVDFAGFSKMVDALGGVEVCSTTPLEDYELGTVLANAGRQTVDGHTALQYVRARQVTTETNGDYGRIKRQQLFLSSLLRSMISKEVFFSLNKLNNVVNMFINDSYVDNMNTKDLVTLGQSVQGIAAGRITFLTVPTTGFMDEYGNEHLREEDNRAIFDAIINDDPLPEEKNADNTPVPGTPESQTEAPSQDAAAPTELVDTITTDPNDITVQVSNSTGEDGLGATAAGELQTHGFNVITPDDYPGPLDTTTVFFSPGNEQAAATVAASFPNSTIERATNLGDVVQVVLGNDFYSVTSPPSSGSPVQVQIVRGTDSTPTDLPEDLTVTNAADTTCE
ncbi:LCP family protein [Mycolicibacterium gadium]|uniref:Transcriptional regulator n=1 Tax=Mycolicibacterium gadium TaxID=1794 RepID=A0A7I7WNF6_MYCGU|nr:LCP family protein [Mycolicibacterium gadium]BBZ19206.1 transcriptional regulator [Mycolicibacterium gadium]